MKKNEVLHSWKEISAYLGRDVRTCYRWESELGLPVHRIDEHSSRSKVFAYPEEIDEWLKERAKNGKHVSLSPKKKARGLILGIAVGSILIAIVFARFYLTPTASDLSLAEPTLAVLPFKNLNASEYDEYFSEGITNEIKSGLIRLNKIKVIPAVDKARTDDPDFDPDYTVLGELSKNEDHIWINISLIREKDGKHVWTAEFESDQDEIFAVKESICQKIHEMIGLEVNNTLLSLSAEGATQNYAAYDSYLKGNFVLSRIAGQDDDPWKLYHQGKYYLGRWTRESNELAISLFSQAIKLDERYALAYIGLAQCYAHNVNLGWDSDPEWLNTAEDLLKKAQNISPDLPEYFSTLFEIYLLKGDSFGRDASGAVLKLVEDAVERYPNDAQLNSIVGYCYLSKFALEGDEADFEKAMEYKEKSFLLNPSSLGNIKYAELLMLEKEFYEAVEVCHWIERAEPSLFSQFMLGEIFYYLGDMDKSREIFLQFSMPLNFKIHSMYFLAKIAAQKGNSDEALRIIQELEMMKPVEYRDLLFQFDLASVYFGIGDKDSGYRCLESLFSDERAREQRFLYSRYIDVDRNFNIWKNEERFQNLLQGDY